ncbi:MAG: SsgA family sporulation/cell division regulator [Pseudonocardia sp.]
MNTLVAEARAAHLGPDGSESPVTVRLVWRASYPWAVEATFRCRVDPAEDPVWLLCRELLWDGIDNPVGAGDVGVRPIDDCQRVELFLSSPDGCAATALSAAALAAFLAITYQQVPAGEELLWAPMDDELIELLNGSDR